VSTRKPYNALSNTAKLKLKKSARFLLKVDRRIKWMGAGMFCFALFSILSFFPEFVERYYSRGLFIGVRYIYDYSLGLLPFSATVWLNIAITLWIIYKVFKFFHFNIRNSEVTISNRIKYIALSLGSFLGTISVIFFIGWGFNYQRTSVEDWLKLDLEPLSPQVIAQELNLAGKLCVEARANIEGLSRDTIFNSSSYPKDLETHMRNNLNTTFKQMGYPTPGKMRCRILENDKWLSSIGYTGIYVSFYGEALVSDKVPNIFIPFFMAHEMAHGYGFFDEADANFFAYLACEQSDNPAIVYSGRLALLIYLNHESKTLNFKIPTEIRQDLNTFGAFGSQEEYNRMIVLVHAWKRKFPLLLKRPIFDEEKEVDLSY